MVDQFSSPYFLSSGQELAVLQAVFHVSSVGLTFSVFSFCFTCLLYSAFLPVWHTFYLHLSWRYGNALAVLALHPTFFLPQLTPSVERQNPHFDQFLAVVQNCENLAFLLPCPTKLASFLPWLEVHDGARRPE